MTHTLSSFLLTSVLLGACHALAAVELPLGARNPSHSKRASHRRDWPCPLSNASIEIEGERIKAVGSSNEVAIPPGARLIDVRGKSVIPGLIDMHVHYQDWMEPLFLRHGVTTVRDMGNNLDVILTRRQWSQKTGARTTAHFCLWSAHRRA